MDKNFLYGNDVLSEHDKVAYVIGDSFEELSRLPRVYTVSQFFKAVFEACLPVYRMWIVGQGIDASERKILRLCEMSQPNIQFHFGEFYAAPPVLIQMLENLEWQNFHFLDSTRVQADLRLLNLSNEALLAHDFLCIAARELSQQACRQAVPGGQLIIKSVQLNRFQQLFPLPITVETQFQLLNDNKCSLKSMTRFYQDFTCAAEVNLLFDLFSEKETQQLIHALGKKTFSSFSSKIE